MTNNSNHGNYYGQIVKLRENGDDWTSEEFRWEIFAAGGPTKWLSSPDNLVFDPHGNLWMVTDSGTGEDSIYEFLGNNSVFSSPTEGPDMGRRSASRSGRLMRS
jgi:secreted PhoX family phosphatase